MDTNEEVEILESLEDGLKKVYKEILLPLEEHYQFHDFHSAKLDDQVLDAKPMIMLVGPYSTGKTTFLKTLLNSDFPGMKIGPEPTTDKFTAVMYDDQEMIIPGNLSVVDQKKPFQTLSEFGSAFLKNFQCSKLPNTLLKCISIVDTPGISSEHRYYNFPAVLAWFAERVDMVIIFFDPHKTDISDEFKRSMEALSGHHDKIRIVLNKADTVDQHQLMRVYGALMWSLRNVLKTPDVVRVFIGSFWDRAVQYDAFRGMFESDERDLLKEIHAMSSNAALRKLDDFISRAKLAKAHAYVISTLRENVPFFGQDEWKAGLLDDFEEICDLVRRDFQISSFSDFPELSKMSDKLREYDFTKFQKLEPQMIEKVDKMMEEEIPKLMKMMTLRPPPEPQAGGEGLRKRKRTES